jgi:hypothetical protein
MNSSDCRDDLIRRNNGIRTLPAEGTILFSSAASFREMIDAYIADGDVFLAGNDRINAYASYWYALGWMDAGVALGLISTPYTGKEPDFSCITMTDTDNDRLQEKTTRYRSLLRCALDSIGIAPEPGSSLHPATESILRVARVWFDQGILLEDSGRMAGALGAYSYGFAWLDAGARFGLFRITKNRELFTI